MSKHINYDLKEKMVALSGACFWYWNSFYSFLDSCGVSRSIQNRFPKESYSKYQVMRNVVNHLEEKGDVETIQNIISNFYRLKNVIDKENLDEDKAKALLSDFRASVGSDPIEREIENLEKDKKKKEAQERIKERQGFQSQLDDLNRKFISLLSSRDITPQARGYALEKLFFELLRINEVIYTPPYKTTGEQIDGHFKHEMFDYLVEIKWTTELTKQPDLSVFDGKIRGKAQSTRGFFLSASGFDQNSIIKYSGDSPRIILMNGEDLALILNGNHLLFDAIKAKVDALVRYGRICFPLREL